MPDVIHRLGSLMTRSKPRLHLRDPSRKVDRKSLDHEVADLPRAGPARIGDAGVIWAQLLLLFEVSIMYPLPHNLIYILQGRHCEGAALGEWFVLNELAHRATIVGIDRFLFIFLGEQMKKSNQSSRARSFSVESGSRSCASS